MNITVRHPGLQTTVQDLGRPMWQHLGVPVGGAMDLYAHRIANLLVGNEEGAAALECAFGGFSMQCDAPVLIALAGRDVTASLDGTAVLPWRPVLARRNELLVLHTGCRTTIAIAGGVDVPRMLDSRSTSLRAAFGGWCGRALQRAVTLPVAETPALAERIMTALGAARRTVADFGAGRSLTPPYVAAPRVRFIPGPEFALLTDTSRAALFGASFRLTPESDRMGFRLSGPPLSLTTSREMLSSGVTAGTIQLPPGGAPIVLMADRQTTGGYPRLGDVITVDLPLLAQLRPGEQVRFAPTTLADAHAEYRRREQDLACAAHALALRFAPGADGAR
ncbi:MAG: biotin-dependent carboxyltransferase family protein [Gemmatimonadaceae bacterium]|nr:biotin-dependent carboxyltransferase family protein [Gemmatimonadaceae bacterium]